MTEHNLTNARTVRGPYTVPEDTPTPVCSQCATALHLVPLEGIRTGTRTWCSDACYRAYINESAAQKVRDHVASPAYRQQQTATRALPAKPVSSSWAPPKPPKSATRQVAEVGANVVGFVIWLIVVSAIAAALFAIFGINSLR